jgi:hypothetical protein
VTEPLNKKAIVCPVALAVTCRLQVVLKLTYFRFYTFGKVRLIAVNLKKASMHKIEIIPVAR